MTRLLICAALGIETRALRRGLASVPDDARVIRTGAGPRRAARAARMLPPYDVIAVVGFGGAVDPSLRPGDVVVADEVRYGGHVYPCPTAPQLARELARDGLRTHIGPLLTCDHVVRQAERPRLADLGVLAVDMETGPLAEAARGRPPAAVRVIVDAPGTPLLGLAVVRAGLAARRVLGLVAPALACWASAVDPHRNTAPALRPSRAEHTIRFSPPEEVRLS
ncbi:hypothetical protein [Sphaerisporangium album]|uniref:phosphorylase family protein n=1 Tax=Sphaerisporangium album TaxID=509200 RepID=UPI0015F00A91